MNPSTHPYLAIVGSRTYPDLPTVRAFARAAATRGYTIVSGGARGVDTVAELGAVSAGSAVVVCKPGRTANAPLPNFNARNQLVVDLSSWIVAFTERGAGGTWDAIQRGDAGGRPVVVFHPSNFPRNPMIHVGDSTHASIHRALLDIQSVILPDIATFA